MAGLEVHGHFGLLRSVAVRPDQQGTGLGQRLCAAIEERASDQEVKALYLLTETAEGFFLKLGFLSLSSDQAPPEIRATDEFQHLCPESAVLMVRQMGLTWFGPAAPARRTS